MTLVNRRGILMGLASALAAPAIVHAGNLMPVKRLASSITGARFWIATIPDPDPHEWIEIGEPILLRVAS